MSAIAYFGAALAEIAGCFAFWAWLRLDKSPWWLVPGIAALCLFAYLLTLVEAEHAGRTYAAYGGVYIASALAWLWLTSSFRDPGPSNTDDSAASSIIRAPSICGQKIVPDEKADLD